MQDENPNLNVEPIIWDAAQVEPDRLLLERADRLDADYKERGYILSVWRYEDCSNWVWFVQYASPGTGYGGPWPEWAFEQAKAALVGNKQVFIVADGRPGGNSLRTVAVLQDQHP